MVVFYNGGDEKEDETVLALSNAFREEIRRNIVQQYRKDGGQLDDAEISASTERIFMDASPNIEVKVRMFNINHGHNKNLLSACRPLGEYAWFVARVRENLAAGRNTGGLKQAETGDAIDRAIDEMRERHVPD